MKDKGDGQILAVSYRSSNRQASAVATTDQGADFRVAQITREDMNTSSITPLYQKPPLASQQKIVCMPIVEEGLIQAATVAAFGFDQTLVEWAKHA